MCFYTHIHTQSLILLSLIAQARSPAEESKRVHVGDQLIQASLFSPMLLFRSLSQCVEVWSHCLLELPFLQLLHAYSLVARTELLPFTDWAVSLSTSEKGCRDTV